MVEESQEKAYLERAEAEMTPLQRVMTNARYEILSHEADFASQGISIDQLQKVSRAAEDRVQAEFEKKEKEDPIRRFVTALHESALTEDEKIYAAQTEERLESERRKLVKLVRTESMRARISGETFNLGETLKNSNTIDVPLDMGTGGKTQFAVHLLVPFVGRPNGNPDNWQVHLNPEYETRVLKAIGVLESDQGLDDLRLYPDDSQEAYQNEKPYHYKSANAAYTHNLPTIVDGVRADVDLGYYPGVKLVSSDLKVIQKIVDFPTS